jgi:hypothetical protein
MSELGLHGHRRFHAQADGWCILSSLLSCGREITVTPRFYCQAVSSSLGFKIITFALSYMV